MDSGNLEEYLNVRETARLLQVHENTVRSYVANGVLASAKLPGSRVHRFARSEVERLIRDRGEATSSVAKPLRQDGPELVGPFDLDAWAARDDAKTAFPNLMDRLLSATSGVTNVNVRSHEGVAAHGWDGTASSKGAPFLPNGQLYFEFGTGENPEKKATEDYNHRDGKLGDHEKGVFVFATPKNWPGAKKWATDKQALGEYAGVEAFDAHRLLSWLRSVPSVHYWLSERLGYSPRDAQTLEHWWSNFQDSLTVKLPESFFVAGRTVASRSLVDRLTSAGDSVEALTIKAANTVEALAFVTGTLVQSDLMTSALVIRDSKAWDRLVESPTPLILIPTFDEPSVAKAIRKGHRVLLLAGRTDVVGPGHVALPRIDPQSANEAMSKATQNFNEGQKLIGLARRNMPAFLRAISRDQRLTAPAWTSDQARAELLARLVLISTWSSSDSDHELLSQVTGRSWGETERTLKALESDGDPVFAASGKSWQLSAPKEAAQLLLPRLISADLDLWDAAAQEVLLTIDPYFGMDFSDVVSAQMNGIRPTYSSELRRGIALSLALAAWSGVTVEPRGKLDEVVDQMMRPIWSHAASDSTGAIWGSLSHEMPLLAEAAPQAFLDAVEQDLEQDHPVLLKLFTDQSSGTPFGASSPHTGLLWALETLCWAPEHFPRAAEALARLAAVDPGGKLSNRPARSFVCVMAGWLRQSGATVNEKLELIGFLTNTMADTMWPILLDLLPDARGFSVSPHGPTYRDWQSEPAGVLMSDWAQYVRGILDLATNLAHDSPERWAKLIDEYEQLPAEYREQLLQSLHADASSAVWSSDETYELWRTLDEKIRRHEEYPESDWALPSDELARLRAIADTVASDSDPRRYIGLFDWGVHFQGMSYGDEGFDEALGKAQVDALTDVATGGVGALRVLAVAVKNAQALGCQLSLASDADILDQQILGWLGDPESQVRDAARGYIQTRILTQGWTWIESNYAAVSRFNANPMRLFASVIPFTHDYWSKLDESAPELIDAYWASHQYLTNKDEYAEAVNRLLALDHPWAAIAVVSNYMHSSDTPPDLNVVKSVLEGLLKTAKPMVDQSMSPYYVSQLLEFMERVVPGDPDLARFEFALFGLLHDKNGTISLFQALNHEPQNFILMVQSLYRADGADKQEHTAAENRFANRAWEILRGWKDIPGQQTDGTIDAEKLQEWVRVARFAFEGSGHTSIGDEQIGEILSASPYGVDGIWPAEEVREIIEATASVRLETGLQIGLYNRRGVTTRSVYEGGDQERALQAKYHGMSVALAPKWRRTSRLLAAIAESYRKDARREDLDAERDADRE